MATAAVVSFVLSFLPLLCHLLLISTLSLATLQPSLTFIVSPTSMLGANWDCFIFYRPLLFHHHTLFLDSVIPSQIWHVDACGPKDGPYFKVTLSSHV